MQLQKHGQRSFRLLDGKMNFYGRNIDPIRLWEKYVDFPPNMPLDGKFLPLVKCPNPNHDTYKRHFQINIEDGLVHCFALCGISGSFTHAIALIEGYYDEAIVSPFERQDSREYKRKIYRAKERAKKFIIKQCESKSGGLAEFRKIKNYEPQSVATIPDVSFSSYLPEAGIQYLNERGVTAESIAKWEIGWCFEEKRIVIPAKDLNEITRFLIKRAITTKQWPKYLYTEGTSKTSLLFGACNLDRKLVSSTGIVLSEGSFDAIKLSQFGVPAVAILGTGISNIQAKIVHRLRPKRIFYFFDRDSSGVKNIELARKRLFKYPQYICRYPKGKNDPAELTRKEIDKAIEKAIPVDRFFRAVERI